MLAGYFSPRLCESSVGFPTPCSAHTSSPLFFGDLGATDPTFKITCKDDGLVFGGICPNMECMNYSRGSNGGGGIVVALTATKAPVSPRVHI